MVLVVRAVDNKVEVMLVYVGWIRTIRLAVLGFKPWVIVQLAGVCHRKRTLCS